jgi:hypothetical protein
MAEVAVKKAAGCPLQPGDISKKGKPNIAPLQLPTLATFRSWGIQQELVVPVC